VLGIAQRARVVSEVRDRQLIEQAVETRPPGHDRRSLVILAVGERRLAVDVSTVSRLEEISRTAIESAGAHYVVQYRGQIMPLVHLATLLGMPTRASDDERPLQVVVHSDRGRSIGLVVDRIVDIVETCVEVSRPARHDDLLVSAVIDERVTDLINVPSLI